MVDSHNQQSNGIGDKAEEDAKSSSSSSPFLSSLWHGLGLFGESYLLFSVGTLRPLWEALYPSCFDIYDNSACAHPELSYQSLTYSVILGVMVGMIVLGAVANNIGRRRGSILTASLMAAGAICLAFCSLFLSSNPSFLFPAMSVCLFLFGMGVGGEYPLSASLASERAMVMMKHRQQHEWLDQSQKMNRLLLRGTNGNNGGPALHSSVGPPLATPLRANLSSKTSSAQNDKREALLSKDDVNAAAAGPIDKGAAPSWQTLQAKAPTTTATANNANNANSANHSNNPTKLTPVVEESYGEEGDSSPAIMTMSPSLSLTHYTRETDINSLSTKNMKLRTRGKEVLWVFSMQGLGILANSLILTALLMITRQRDAYGEALNDDEMDDYYNNAMNQSLVNSYNPTTLLNIWRLTYITGAIILLYVLISRIFHLPESEVWKQDQQLRKETQEHQKELQRIAEQKKQEEEEQERKRKEGSFQPPHVTLGPYEKRMMREENNAKKSSSRKGGDAHHHHHHPPPVISPTMSSITMKSEFDMLGSTNLDGCKLVPAMMTDHESDDDDDDDEEDGDDSQADAEDGSNIGGGFCGDCCGKKKKKKRRSKKKGKASELMLLVRHYGVRLFGTSVTWLLWDIAYYGNKLFQSSFLIALTGDDATLVDIMGASAINAFIALLGYYAAASIVDDPDVGRLALQQTGFVITGTLFLLCGTLNDRLSSTWLIIMYFASSFFGQCGPNCTTFLIPTEIFPTNQRALCHGISASMGKLGALIASILFHFVTERDLFLFSGYAAFAASLITFVTIPETTTLDLYEIDKQWHKVLIGEKYEGPATDPKHLSFYERNQNRLCCSKR